MEELRHAVTHRALLRETPTALVLVGVVPAVVVVVALPAARHAAVVLAAELVRLTRPLSCTHTAQQSDT